ncbi:transmembrane protein [Spiroplasma chinense]|uniref:Transmembrane protein n=1 Tax=Spiroplasma chinense TaxID=216932 RepID=A0A5B9Y5Q8_9MOLU|nr:hypothetical protein [Spiroplasma chinense]QEH61607.1 transmembrane protein [Spiroplasma chinense]
MDNMSRIVYLATILTFITLLTLKVYNTIAYSKIKVININSADINISTSKINELIEKFLIYLNATELSVVYGESDTYSRISNMLNKNKKVIEIPKWFMPSVGYELDYIIASIWYNVTIYKKDKDLKKFNLISNILPKVFLFIYSIAIFFVFLLFILNNVIISKIDNFHSFLWYIERYHVLDAIAITSFLGYIITIYNSTKLKYFLEAKYERDIVKFVDKECSGYKSDISAARVYALDIEKLHYNIFRFNSKTSHLKFLGPFTNL